MIFLKVLYFATTGTACLFMINDIAILKMHNWTYPIGTAIGVIEITLFLACGLASYYSIWKMIKNG